MCYADGVFDARFNHYVTVWEGGFSSGSSRFVWSISLKMFSLGKYLYSFLISVHQRGNSLNPTTKIVTVELGSEDIQGKNLWERTFYSYHTT